MLHNGLYEQIINKGLDSELSVTDKLSQTAPIDSAEASKVLAKYVAEIVEKGLDNVKDNGGDLNSQVDLVNRIVSTIMTETKETDFDTLSVAERAEQLLALFDKKNSVLALDEKAEIIRPETSIAQSSLFTGAIHEPQMFTELKKEIVSCNRIDMLVSFIKWSGLRLIMDELTTFTQNGGKLRIITTSYMGATDVKAIEELRKLPNTLIKVSYDTKRTRLHAKTYVFYRDTGFTTAYVGSSNLSNAAISSGLEWNVKVTKKDLPETIDKIAATFESYWNSNEFEYYSEDQKERLARALKAEKYFDTNNAEIYTMDIQPYSYQQEILDKLDAERNVRGYYHNLVVAATGTGKTVISALDYKHFRKQNADRPCRLLFVAHREEILKQSLYTFRAVLNRRADLVASSLLKYVTDIDDVKGLGFCVTIEHAEFMSDYFNAHGIPSMFLTGKSPDEERKEAKNRLVSGDVRFIFVVDIYNEGVDIPEVNTVLFLRPTESLTVFLQQLGRGLRLSEDKECLTVLDFIGQANRKYNFEDKFAALLSNTTRSVTREIKDGFISLPKGCYVQLEKKAAKYILDNIRASYGNSAGLVMRIASFEEDTGLKLTLANFLDYYHIDPRQIYKFDTFSRLCARADVINDFSEPLEETMQKAFARLCTIDSRRLIKFLLNILPNIDNTDFSKLSPIEQRMMQMFYVSVWLKAADDWNSDEVLENLYALADSPILLGELIDLLQYNYDHIDFIDKPVNVGFDCPLDLHCTYTRDQLLVALDFMKPSTVREGVKWLPEKNIDVFFVTLNKADKDYSPTTMYNDYSINSELFHWQSQSTTAADSPTGQRYIHHREKGSRVLLFVREFKSDRISGSAAAYTYLGTANYVKHDGEKPMNITWKLNHPIPAKYLKKTNKLVVG